MKYLYPRLSQHDWNIMRLGGPGLGNLLFTYGRAVAESKRYVTIQYPVKGTFIFGQNRENKISVSSLL